MLKVAFEVGGTLWCCCSLRSVDRTINGLRSELSSALNGALEAERELEEERGRSRTLQRELRRYGDREATIADLEEKLSAQIMSHEEASRSHQARWQVLNDRCTGLQREISIHKETIACLEADRDLWRQRHSSASCESESAVRALESRLRFLEAENASLTEEVSLYHQRSSTLSADLENLTGILDTAKTNYLNLEWQQEEEISRLLDNKIGQDADLAALRRALRRQHEDVGNRVAVSVQTSANIDLSISTGGACRLQHLPQAEPQCPPVETVVQTAALHGEPYSARSLAEQFPGGAHFQHMLSVICSADLGDDTLHCDSALDSSRQASHVRLSPSDLLPISNVFRNSVAAYRLCPCAAAASAAAM
ncbi:hypothetical protein C8Q77DRAFT_1076954 [Trametes polyzona]|nr:hypothetical protein C8Q77DRAFT_1076954 [Trametes polyzona]